MHIQRPFLLIAIAVASAGANGGPLPDKVVAVELANFDFTPSTVEMVHGQGYVLRLTNISDGGHDFAAPAFFAAARIDPEDARAIDDGQVEVAGGQTVVIRLTAPSPGIYRVRCTHFLHSTFGMKGRIVVT
jgi:uncharacterized cupredoxin-like copper-binding protein